MKSWIFAETKKSPIDFQWIPAISNSIYHRTDDRVPLCSHKFGSRGSPVQLMVEKSQVNIWNCITSKIKLHYKKSSGDDKAHTRCRTFRRKSSKKKGKQVSFTYIHKASRCHRFRWHLASALRPSTLQASVFIIWSTYFLRHTKVILSLHETRSRSPQIIALACDLLPLWPKLTSQLYGNVNITTCYELCTKLSL